MKDQVADTKSHNKASTKGHFSYELPKMVYHLLEDVYNGIIQLERQGSYRAQIFRYIVHFFGKKLIKSEQIVV